MSLFKSSSLGTPSKTFPFMPIKVGVALMPSLLKNSRLDWIAFCLSLAFLHHTTFLKGFTISLIRGLTTSIYMVARKTIKA